MHPVLFRIGTFEVGTYGLILALGFFAALALAKRQAKLDGIPGEAVSDLAMTVLLAGLAGSRILYIIVELVKGAPPSEVFSLGMLRAAGAVHGGILGALAAFLWRSKKLGLRLGVTGDALVPATALGQAIGRLGCLMAGCCYGTVCEQPWAIRFTNADAYRFSGTPLYEHLHPVQLYTFAANLAVMGLLLWLRPRRRFEGQVLSAYFILEGLARAVVETWRGDGDRGFWLGLSWLSTGRATALLFVAIGVVLAVILKRSSAKIQEA
jgi:phosphatidylglycerol:prolipoprotein diacylglycerol transferase